MRLRKNHHPLVTSALFALMFVFDSNATPPRTDDLLPSLPSKLRSEILSGATAEEICEIRALQRDFQFDFVAGSPPSNAGDPSFKKNCSDSTRATVKISSAADLRSEAKRYEWFGSFPAYCQYKKKLASSITRSVRKIAKNPDYEFLDMKTFQAGQLCVLGGTAAKVWKSNLKDSYCAVAQGNTASAVECLYQSACRMDCGSGVTSMQAMSAYELFAGDDGVMTRAEAALFELHYPVLAIGPYQGNSTRGIEASASSFEGARANRRYVNVPGQADLGEFGLTGYRIVVDLKHADKKFNGSPRTEGEYNQMANMTENGIVISTSKEAAALLRSERLVGNPSIPALVGKFETDMKELASALRAMSYEGDTQHLESPGAYDQITRKDAYPSIMAGTYEFKNLTGDDLRHIRKAYAILKNPIYRDTRLYVHPYGEVSLGQISLILANQQMAKPQMTVVFGSTSEGDQYNHFLQSRIEGCTGKTFSDAGPIPNF